MEIHQVGNNNVTACECCDLLIVNKETWELLCDQLSVHLSGSPKCKAHYDALPTFEDIRGIASKPADE